MSTAECAPTLDRGARASALVALVTVVVLALALVALGTGGALAATDENESAPALHSGEKINTTAVELLFVDNHGINASSISASEFLLSEGALSGVAVTSEGTNATVELTLAEPIASDELTVGLRPNSTIQNVNGTAVDTGETQSVTISGMDGIGPRVLGVSVGDAIGGPAELEFRFDERISDLAVEVTGPANDTLDIDDFENTKSYRYVAEYEPPESGEYTVTLVSATDTAGNDATLSVSRTLEADRRAPEAVIGVDFGASEGTNLTFDASQSRGDRLEYRWEFGDGANATGERVAHEFEPGTYTVTLEVRDGFNNTGTDRLDLNLTGGVSDGTDIEVENQTGPVVIVDRDGATATRSALVSVTGALATQPVDIGALDESGEPLLAHEDFTLDGLSVTPTTNTSFSLALAATGSVAVADTENDETTAIGGFTVLSDLGGVDSAEFEFSVDAGALNDRGLSATDVQLHRELASEWVALETSVEASDEERYRFAAATPGFSRFAIVSVASEDGTDENNGASTGDGVPSFEVTDAAVNASTVESGESVRVDATVQNQGDGAGDFRAGLELDGEVVETRDLTGIDAGDTGTVAFTQRLDEEGTVDVSVNGTDAGDVTVEEREEEDELDFDEEAFTVTEIRLNETSIDPGDGVLIEGDVLNEGDEIADFVAKLEVDGEVVDYYEVPQVPPGDEILMPAFEKRFDERGTYTITITGSESEAELAVGQSGFFDFLPMGLVRTLLSFLGIPLLFVFLVLKSVAFYLGY